MILTIGFLLGSLSCLSDGMHYGWSAPIIPILESPGTPVNVTHTDITLIEISNMIGGFCGLPFTIFFVDSIGRKYSIMISITVGVICWIMLASAKSVAVICSARFLSGVIGNVAFVSTPMYIAEVSEETVRGFLSGMTYLGMLLGLVTAYVTVPFMEVWQSSMVGIAILVVQFCTFTFMPESPYFFLMKNKKDKALKSLRWLRNTDDVEDELDEIAVAVARQQSEKGRPQDLLLVPSNRKGMIIMSVLNGAQHFTGISVILMNLHSIFLAAEFDFLDERLAAVIFSVLMFIAATTAVSFVDRSGRKILLIVSSFLTGICLLAIAVYFSMKNAGHDTKEYSWIPVAATMAYAVVFKSGLGIVPIILTGELFPTSVKAMGMTFADAMYVIFSILSVYMYQALGKACGLQAPFYVFSAVTLLTAAFSYYYVPETKGKTLEEIQLMLKGYDKRDFDEKCKELKEMTIVEQ